MTAQLCQKNPARNVPNSTMEGSQSQSSLTRKCMDFLPPSINIQDDYNFVKVALSSVTKLNSEKFSYSSQNHIHYAELRVQFAESSVQYVETITIPQFPRKNWGKVSKFIILMLSNHLD